MRIDRAVGLLLVYCLPICCLANSPLRSDTIRSDVLPADVPADNWAAPAVREVVKNGVMTPTADHKFHGNDHVSQADAAIAIAKAAHELLDGSWQRSPSVSLGSRAAAVVTSGSWQQQAVTRYICAKVLAQSADYIANGLPRPPAGSTDLGKSAVLAKVPVTLAHTNPAYEAVEFLAAHRMLGKNSPLLSADSRAIKGAELSLAMQQMLAGVTDALTDLGHDANGSTKDNSFHPKKH